jgi:hypothetical protein
LQFSKVSLAFAPACVLSYQQKQQISAYLLKTQNCSLQLVINFRKNCGVTDITVSLSFKNKSNLAIDPNVKHSFWKSNVSSFSVFKLL